MTDYVKRFDPQRTNNSQLMADVHRLGYLQDDHHVLDLTFGKGNFWREFVPARFQASDLHTYSRRGAEYDHGIHTPDGKPVYVWNEDFTGSDWQPLINKFHTVVFDPPYKYNGTPTNTGGMDDAYGVNNKGTPDERDKLIRLGLNEAMRLASNVIMVKCQNQIVSGKLRAQQQMVTDWVTSVPSSLGNWRLADELYVYSYRPQPARRTQHHAHSTTSALLIFKRKA